MRVPDFFLGKGDRVIICPHCDYQNPDDQILCIQCSMPLKLDQAALQADTDSKGTTQMLDEDPQAPSVPRWGTASLGTERKLLLHVRGHDTPLVVPLAERLVVGRYDTETEQSPEIDLSGYDASKLGVSRQHAVILVEDDGLKVMDLNSANFSYINGQRLIAHQSRILRDGDELRLGHMVIRIAFA